MPRKGHRSPESFYVRAHKKPPFPLTAYERTERQRVLRGGDHQGVFNEFVSCSDRMSSAQCWRENYSKVVLHGLGLEFIAAVSGRARSPK